MTPPLSSALHAWSLQGPALLRAALSAKDAELRRVRAERDARAREVGELRDVVDTLRAAVDQLVALCTAQVAELSRHPHENASAARREEDENCAHDALAAVERALSFTATLQDTDACTDFSAFLGGPVPDVPKDAAPEKKAKRVVEGGPKQPTGRRGSFSGLSSVSSNKASTNATVRSEATDGGPVQGGPEPWEGLFDDAGSVPSYDDWEYAHRKEMAARRFEEVKRGRRKKKIVPQHPNSEERDPTQSATMSEETIDIRHAEMPPDVRQFTMEEEGQVQLPLFARPCSDYVGIGDAGQCIIKDAAFFVSGSRMPCQMTVTLEPEQLDSYLTTFIHFEYPDHTMLPFIPVCNLRVKGAQQSFTKRLGHDMQGLLRSNSYGRDYVRLQLPASMFHALIDSAEALMHDLYPEAELDEIYLPVANSDHVEFFAQLVSPHPVMRGQRWDASIAELLMESESDIVGDGTILMRFLEGHGSMKLDFVLHRMQMEDDEGNTRSVV